MQSSFGRTRASSKKMVAFDNFNRANGALGTSTSGHAWTGYVGTWTIASNMASEPGGNGNTAYIDVPGTVDAEIFVTLPDVSTQGLGIFGRGNSGATMNTFYLLSVDATAARLWRVVSGSFTTIGQINRTAVSGDRVGISMKGTSIKAVINGQALAGATDSNITSGTRMGIRAGINSTAKTWDDFAAFRI